MQEEEVKWEEQCRELGGDTIALCIPGNSKRWGKSDHVRPWRQSASILTKLLPLLLTLLFLLLSLLQAHIIIIIKHLLLPPLLVPVSTGPIMNWKLLSPRGPCSLSV